MRPIALGGRNLLRAVALDDVDELHAVIVTNRDHLAPWLPWAGGQQHDGTAGFVTDSLALMQRGDGWRCVIVHDGRIVGSVGADHHPGRWATTLGYWIAADAERRGTVTAAVRAMLGLVFDTGDMHRVEVRVALGNTRSERVVERLGFVREGVLRAVVRFADHWQDATVYSMLAPEWHAGR